MLQAQGLSIGYGPRCIGQGFDLRLEAGQVLALLGPNGGGKTTLLKTLLGLLPPLAGAVTLDGQPLARLDPRQRARRLAYVPQSTAAVFAYTVVDLVLMGRSAQGSWLSRPSAQDHAAVAAAIERMGIGHLAHTPATQLSGGERQLALIARALAQQAGFVVLDEPTASLDFGNQGKVLRELRRLAGQGLGVLFTTHDPNHARRHADTALLIRDGRTLGSGPVQQVLQRQTLQQLYQAPVDHLQAGGQEAFLPA